MAKNQLLDAHTSHLRQRYKIESVVRGFLGKDNFLESVMIFCESICLHLKPRVLGISAAEGSVDHCPNPVYLMGERPLDAKDAKFGGRC